MKKNLLISISTVVLLLLSSTGHSFAQSHIAGLVTNEEGKPLPHCTVRAMQDGTIISTTVTNGEGHYNLSSLAPGNYTLTYYYGNIKNNVTSVRVSDNAITTVNTHINTIKTKKAENIALQEIAKRPLINWQYPTSRTLYADDLAHMPGY
jgi:hypothetical protein